MHQTAIVIICLFHYENTAPDIYDFDQNGDTTQLVPYASLTLLADSSNVVNVLKMSKSANDPNFQINNDTQVTRNELFQYKFFVRNDSDDEMLYVTIIDIFPFVGDLLGSAWEPRLEEVPLAPEYVTVFYSQSTTPAMEPIGTGGVNDWSTTPPADLHSVKALKFDFGDTVFASGESAEILLTMSAPASAQQYTYSYNSVSYIASARDINGHVTQYLPAYSPPAYARLTFREFDTFVGDFVWYDLNGNGIQDVGEPGINGVTVQLLDTNGNILYEQLTHNHPTTGAPGYYGFEGVWPQTYIAKFPVVVEDIYTLTIPHQVLRENNSVANPATGLSGEFIVYEGAYINYMDAGYVSADPPLGKIGDYVWLDLNKNGIHDNGEPGINGVPVELYSRENILLQSTVTFTNPLTDQSGYYEFTAPAGEYYLAFPTSLAGGELLTVQNAGTNPNVNSKPNPQNGFTAMFYLGEGQSILNMDAGYITAPPPPVPEFEITKCTSKCCVTPCEKFFYRITVANTGEVPLENLQIIDTISLGEVIIKKILVEIDGLATSNITVDVQNSTYIITVHDNILSGSTVTITLYAVVNPCACPATVWNSAEASAGGYIATTEPVGVVICRKCCK